MGRLSAGYPDYVSLSMCMLQDCMTAAALMVVAILSYCRSEGIMNIYVGGGIQTERARHGEDWLGGSVSPTLFPVPAEKSRLEAVANSALEHSHQYRHDKQGCITCAAASSSAKVRTIHSQEFSKRPARRMLRARVCVRRLLGARRLSSTTHAPLTSRAPPTPRLPTQSRNLLQLKSGRGQLSLGGACLLMRSGAARWP